MSARLAQEHSDPGVVIGRLYARFKALAQPAYRSATRDLSYAALHDAAGALAQSLARLPRAQHRPPVLIWGHKHSSYPG
ncbi:D-alanine--poly(phosphoribitol) ligase, partial [Phaeobacter sp. HF9A]|nr:D-alanine--poly(phosphoribitol) ligase [Phaeobacter sp. HF9A]